MTDKPEKPVRIRRAVHNQDLPYFQAARKTAQDTKLSYEALGLLTYLLSKPDDWQVIPSTLTRESCGKNRVYTLLNELIEKCYIVRNTNRDAKGRIIQIEYVVMESPLPANHEVDNHEHDFHDNTYKRVERKKKKDSSAVAEIVPEVPDSEASQAKPEKLTGAEWAELIKAIGEVFKAHGPEAINYANMLTGRAKSGEWAKCNLIPVVKADDLRLWWKWYRQNNQTITQLKDPVKVYSSIVEWRNSDSVDNLQDSTHQQFMGKTVWYEGQFMTAGKATEYARKHNLSLFWFQTTDKHGNTITHDGTYSAELDKT